MELTARLAILPGVSLQPGWLEASEATRLLDSLWQDLEWRQDEITVFGKSRPQPRLTAWCSDPEVYYSYSGLQLQPRQWHPKLAALREQLAAETGQSFNSVLVNAYRDGQDAMGWHSDDERELGPKPVIASLSLGASRKFRLRARNTKLKPRRSTGVDLAHGDLLLMKGNSQQTWQHCIARTRKPTGLRINLTYRNVIA